MGLKSTITKSNTSKLIEQKMLNDYKYATRTVNQAGNYNKITNYLILHIRKTYKHGRDITDTIENLVMGMLVTGISQTWGKCEWKILISNRQKTEISMNHSHNDDVMNENG